VTDDLQAIADLTNFFVEKIKEEFGEDLSKMSPSEIALMRAGLYPSMDIIEAADGKKMISSKEIFKARRREDT